ncbi:MAG: WYL domain-containing protein [Dehalococcoidia bacterium]
MLKHDGAALLDRQDGQPDCSKKSWRELAAELRARGIGRGARDTRQSMIARLREAEPPSPPRRRSWRELAAELRAQGLRRRSHDTCGTMAARLQTGANSVLPAPLSGETQHAAPKTRASATDHRAGLRRLNAEAAAPPLATPAQLQLLPALAGHPSALDTVEALVLRLGGCRVAREVVLLPAGKIDAFLRAIRRRWPDLGLAGQVEVATVEPSAALWAAAHFVSGLGTTLAWPAGLLPPDLATLPPLADAAAARQAQALLRLWTAALDARLDPLAEVIAERPHIPSSERPADLEQTLRTAITEGRPARLRYQGHSREAVTCRDVEPRTLQRQRGHVYLRAFCRWRNEQRLFRLDRILEAKLLDEHISAYAPAPSVFPSPLEG